MFDVAPSHLFAVERVIGLATDPQTGSFRLYQNSKPVIATFDVAHASSDGGALLLKAIDGQLVLPAALAGLLLLRRSGPIFHLLLLLFAANLAILAPLREVHHQVSIRYATALEVPVWIGLGAWVARPRRAVVR
ncbi:MAG: hypothetical protein ACREIY_07350, partial [Candidatus Rokuibacteriota bacterium]